ncbi:MAG: peptidase M22, partial [Clostridia bacterium]|nr:peptidase M22 [Clostridia bacterium]
MKNCFLGIDTSAYTTSVALVDGNGIVLANEKTVLPVPPGERGLRQSDALFHHIRQLPVLFERLRPLFTEYELRGVGVSDRPRPMPESYMPVFFAGVSAATAISSARGVPLKTFSHQEGHIAAALAGSESTDL